MAYTPTNWVSGDVVTAQKMNKLEQGVANIGAVVNLEYDDNDDEYAFDTTAGEVYDLMVAGTPVVTVKQWEADSKTCVAAYLVRSVVTTGPDDFVFLTDSGNYYADSRSDYPHESNGR